MNNKDIIYRETTDNDLISIIEVQKSAFGGNSVAQLTAELLEDDSAMPKISLLAFDSNIPVGHILFTKCSIEGINDCPLIHILAPLAVIPEYQNQGIGGKLTRKGLNLLKEMKSEIVFVLGHIDYYPKHGFINDAGSLGYTATYPIPKKDKDAWMIMSLNSNKLTNFGKVICAKAMDKPEHWRE